MTHADAPLVGARSWFEVASRYLGVADAIAALVYPLALIALYDGGQMLRAAGSWETRLSAWSVTLGAAVLVYSVPVASFWIIYRLGQLQQPCRAQLRARASAHLAFASPPLFTAIGVLFYLLHSSRTISSGRRSGWRSYSRLCLRAMTCRPRLHGKKAEPQSGSDQPMVFLH